MFSLNFTRCTIEQHFEKLIEIMDGSGIKECDQDLENCCNIFSRPLINDNYEKFVSLMKESLVPNWLLEGLNEERLKMNNTEFTSKFIFGSKFLGQLNFTLSASMSFISEAIFISF